MTAEGLHRRGVLIACSGPQGEKESSSFVSDRGQCHHAVLLAIGQQAARPWEPRPHGKSTVHCTAVASQTAEVAT
eukprot:14841303-Alexandrium_andersonii.AAC.1